MMTACFHRDHGVHSRPMYSKSTHRLIVFGIVGLVSRPRPDARRRLYATQRVVCSSGGLERQGKTKPN